MKRLFTILLLCAMLATTVVAGDVIVLWLNLAASNHDKVETRDMLYSVLNDRSKISVADLPVWERTSNTNIAGWIVCIDRDWLLRGRFVTNLNNVTREKFDSWRSNNLDNANHLMVRTGSDSVGILADAGLQERKP